MHFYFLCLFRTPSDNTEGERVLPDLLRLFSRLDFAYVLANTRFYCIIEPILICVRSDPLSTNGTIPVSSDFKENCVLVIRKGSHFYLNFLRKLFYLIQTSFIIFVTENNFYIRYYNFYFQGIQLVSQTLPKKTF